MTVIEKLRTPKLLGSAVFDLVSGFVATGIIGRYVPVFGTRDFIFNGLMSIPLSVAVHAISHTSTPLTDFVLSGSEHVWHSVALGLGVGAVLEVVTNSSRIAVANSALATSIVGALYMSQYGHGLPKPVRKRLFRLLLRWRRMFSAL